MPRRKHTTYVVEHKNGEKEFYKTKKEICDVYGIPLAWVNHAIIIYPLSINIGVNKENGKIKVIWIRYRTCKDCADYMIESKNCYKTKNCLYYEKK